MNPLGSFDYLPEAIWEKMPDDCLRIIIDGVPDDTAIYKKAKKVFSERQLVAIIKLARKLRRKEGLTIEHAITQACAQIEGGSERYFEVCTMFRKIGGRFGKYPPNKKKKEPVRPSTPVQKPASNSPTLFG